MAKHNDRTVQVAKANGFSNDREGDQGGVSTKSSSSPLAKSPASSRDKGPSIDSDLPQELADHLNLLSELDRQVEDLFSQARRVFSTSEKPRRRKGDKRRPAQTDPMRTELDKDLEYLE